MVREAGRSEVRRYKDMMRSLRIMFLVVCDYGLDSNSKFGREASAVTIRYSFDFRLRSCVWKRASAHWRWLPESSNQPALLPG